MKSRTDRELQVKVAALRAKQVSKVGTLGHHNAIALRAAQRAAIARPICVECGQEVFRPVSHPRYTDLRVCGKCEAQIREALKKDEFYQDFLKTEKEDKAEKRAAFLAKQANEEAERKQARDAARAAARAEAEAELARRQKRSAEWGV